MHVFGYTRGLKSDGTMSGEHAGCGKTSIPCGLVCLEEDFLFVYGHWNIVAHRFFYLIGSIDHCNFCSF